MNAPLPAASDNDQEHETLIDLSNITFEIKGRKILDQVSLKVNRGEILTLIGPNGAGKSTLVEIALGLQHPTKGSVSRKSDMRVGYVPQKLDIDPVMPLPVHRLMSLTQKASKTEIVHALQEVRADHLFNQSVTDLSGGELQRVALARAMLRRPDLLVLDEPTQGVDYVGEAEIYQLIADLRDQHQCGVVLISHDIHIVMAATDRVICLNNHVCCAGHPETVSQNPEYVALFGNRGAANIGIYTHNHDHDHDIDGTVVAPGHGVGHIHGPGCQHD